MRHGQASAARRRVAVAAEDNSGGATDYSSACRAEDHAAYNLSGRDLYGCLNGHCRARQWAVRAAPLRARVVLQERATIPGDIERLAAEAR